MSHSSTRQDPTPMTTAVYLTLAYLQVEAGWLADQGRADRIDARAEAIRAGRTVAASNPVQRIVRHAARHLIRPARNGGSMAFPRHRKPATD